MAQEIKSAALDTTVNCCNGRVGRRILELAAQDERFARLAMPSGVELVKEAAAAGLAAADTVNCCNGRVGRRLDLSGIVAQLSEAGDDG
jgi:hypothetical protein